LRADYTASGLSAERNSFALGLAADRDFGPFKLKDGNERTWPVLNPLAQELRPAVPARPKQAIGSQVNYPGFIPPALASPIERVPSGER
jgi:hypothetical protein